MVQVRSSRCLKAANRQQVQTNQASSAPQLCKPSHCTITVLPNPCSTEEPDLQRTGLNKHPAEVHFMSFYDQLNKCIIYTVRYDNSWLINKDLSALYCLCLETLLSLPPPPTRQVPSRLCSRVALAVLQSRVRASSRQWPRHKVFSVPGTPVLLGEEGSYVFVKHLRIPHWFYWVKGGEIWGGRGWCLLCVLLKADMMSLECKSLQVAGEQAPSTSCSITQLLQRAP